MNHTWTLTKSRMQLALRNRAFVFFSVVMPVAFLFLYLGVFSRAFGGGTPQSGAFLMGPILALTVMGSFWGLSIQLVTFREQGILRRFRLAPIGAAAMLASSVLSNYFLTLPTIVLEFALARWIFGLKDFGNLWSVLLLVSMGTITFASFGLIVASVTNTMQETQVINNVIWSLFLFLSGATVPLLIMPVWVQKASLFLPATYLVTGLQQAVVLGAGLWQVKLEIISLAVGAITAFVISAHLFRWESEEKVTRRAKLMALATVIPFLLLGAWENATGNLRRQAQAVYQQMRAPSQFQRDAAPPTQPPQANPEKQP